jgi:RNA polymerase sigma-70 factor (ECF subfamily)
MDYEKLFDEYYDKIFIYIARRINNTHDAEDLTAGVFLNAFINPYDPKMAEFSTYIYTIAANALKNYYRQAHKQNTSDINEFEELAGLTDILGDFTRNEEYAALRDAMTGLTEKQYDIIYRRYYLEQTFAEIGAAADVTEVYARKIHQRALNRLKSSLKKDFYTDVSRFGELCV